MDNLNIHSRVSVITVLGEPAGRRLWQRIEVHYTPKHASWLDAAELEASMVSSVFGPAPHLVSRRSDLDRRCMGG